MSTGYTSIRKIIFSSTTKYCLLNSGGEFLDLLKQAFDKDQLVFKGDCTCFASKKKFAQFKSNLYKMNWVVNIQAPFGKPEKVLEYLSRYVFRIAITNRRIIEVKDGKVLFSWKDYRTKRFRKMRLEIDEFIRRFLLHILPKGFFKVRHYGIFCSRYGKENIIKAKQLLADELVIKKHEASEDGDRIWEKQNAVWGKLLKMIQNFKKPNCPQCKKGRLRFAGVVPINNKMIPVPV